MKRTITYAGLVALAGTILLGGVAFATGATARAALTVDDPGALTLKSPAPDSVRGGTAGGLVCIAWQWVYHTYFVPSTATEAALQSGASVVAARVNPVYGVLVCVAWDIIPVVVQVVAQVAPAVYEVADAISEPVGDSPVEVPSSQGVIDVISDTLSGLNPLD